MTDAKIAGIDYLLIVLLFRTAINSQSGVRTPAGGIWTAAVILLALGVLTPYFLYIPQSALAAVIICAVLPMFEYEVIPKLFRVKSKYLMQIFCFCAFKALAHYTRNWKNYSYLPYTLKLFVTTTKIFSTVL